MIRAAIVGLGRWGRVLVESLDGGSAAIRFTRAVTRTPSSAAEFAAARGLALDGDYRSALDDPDVDAVVLATPHSLHCGQICAAAEAGKHVFCEKPLALTAAEAGRAAAAAKDAGVCLAIGHNRRFAPNMRALQEALASGALGAPIHFEGNFSANLGPAAGTWRSDARESPAGGMTSLGIHVLDAFIALAGPISSVAARSARLALPFAVDDSTSVLIDFANGCTGYLGTVAATAHLYRVRAIGTGGWAEIDALDRFESALIDGSGDRKDWEGYGYPGSRSVRDCLEAFAEAAGGGASFPIAPEDMVHAAAALEAIAASAETGLRQAV